MGTFTDSKPENRMALHLKRRIAQDVTDELDRKVRQTVEDILADVRKRGDAAVREYSEKFDKWAPKRLSKQDLDSILSRVSASTIKDIEFAQSQIRSFAEHQKAALKDLEIETLPVPIVIVSLNRFDGGQHHATILVVHVLVMDVRQA